MERERNQILSSASQRVTEDDVHFKVVIYMFEDGDGWSLEVVTGLLSESPDQLLPGKMADLSRIVRTLLGQWRDVRTGIRKHASGSLTKSSVT